MWDDYFELSEASIKKQYIIHVAEEDV